MYLNCWSALADDSTGMIYNLNAQQTWTPRRWWGMWVRRMSQPHSMVSDLCVVTATWSRKHLVHVYAGPVARVLASLFKDFREKFNAWVVKRSPWVRQRLLSNFWYSSSTKSKIYNTYWSLHCVFGLWKLTLVAIARRLIDCVALTNNPKCTPEHHA